MVDAVREIRDAGARTGLVTSKNRLGALRGLTLVRLERMMDVLVCADEVTNPKPHPEPVEKAVALLGADPATTVYVGDSIHDMQSGRAAGVRTVAVLWGPFGRSHLEGAKPDYWVETPEELVELGKKRERGRKSVSGERGWRGEMRLAEQLPLTAHAFSSPLTLYSSSSSSRSLRSSCSIVNGFSTKPVRGGIRPSVVIAFSV